MAQGISNTMMDELYEAALKAGATGGKMKDDCEYLFNIPSNDTPRIQESHILIGHILCELVEENLVNSKFI